MPSILVFSDLHDDAKCLERLMAIEADHYVAAGDLSNFGNRLDRMGEVMRPKSSQVWVMPGNHESDTQVAAFCDRFGFHNFHGETFRAGGLTVAGLGYSNPTPFRTPGEYTEEQLASRLQRFELLRPEILICHAPPLETALDRAGPGKHYGSRAIRDFLERFQPQHFFCGHIHEAEGAVEHISATRAQNVGKRGYLLELTCS